jgi:hypothetical protein
MTRRLSFQPAALAVGYATLAMASPALAQAPADVSASTTALDLAPATPPPLPPGPAPAPAPASPPSEQVTAQIGTRVTFRVQNPTTRDKLNDVGSEGEADAVFWGQVHRFLKWQAGFVGSYGDPTASTSAAVLDLVAKLELADALNLWIGRMPIPSDRASLSTVWALSTWTMPGTYGSYPSASPAGFRPWPGPRRGINGRGDGVTVWGQVRGGRLKYYAGAFDLGQPTVSPLYSARLSFSMLSPDPGFRSSSGYYGGKNILALGIGGQHQANGSLPPVGGGLTQPSDYSEVHADLLFEMGSGAMGVLNAEGAVGKAWGDHEVGSYQVVALASYLVPIDIGIGRFQPLLRYQHAGMGNAEDGSEFTSVDAQLGYIIDGYHARLLAVYQYSRLHSHDENAILFGLQLLSHAK